MVLSGGEIFHPGSKNSVKESPSHEIFTKASCGHPVLCWPCGYELTRPLNLGLGYPGCLCGESAETGTVVTSPTVSQVRVHSCLHCEGQKDQSQQPRMGNTWEQRLPGRQHLLLILTGPPTKLHQEEIQTPRPSTLVLRPGSQHVPGLPGP